HTCQRQPSHAQLRPFDSRYTTHTAPLSLHDALPISGFTSGLLSSLAMNLSAGAARTHYPVLYLLAAAEIAVYFMVFTFLIRRFDLRTPGREEEAPTQAPAGREEGFPFKALVAALGGRENILRVDNCLTR